MVFHGGGTKSKGYNAGYEPNETPKDGLNHWASNFVKIWFWCRCQPAKENDKEGKNANENR